MNEQEDVVVDSPVVPEEVREVRKSVPLPEAPARKNPNIFISVKALSTKSKARNSRSVSLTQGELILKGFLDAGTDNRGTFGEGTEKALREFCGCAKTPCAPHPMATIEKLFADTDYTIIE